MDALTAMTPEQRLPSAALPGRHASRHPGEASAGAKNAELSAPELAEVARLAQADHQVRQHEMAHMAAGAGLITGGARYSYRSGPDGRSYAVAGEVGISMARGHTPEGTLARARRIQAAALAPADPSAQDHAVAASAARMALQAQVELARSQAGAVTDGDVRPDDRSSGDASTASRAYRDMDLFLRRENVSFSARA